MKFEFLKKRGKFEDVEKKWTMKNLIKSAIASTMLFAGTALAQNNRGGVEGVIERGTDVMTLLTILFFGLCAVAGIVFMIRAGMSMAKHNEDKREHPMSKILLNFIGGAVLLGVGATNDTLQQTIFGNAVDNQQGADVENFGSQFNSNTGN